MTRSGHEQFNQSPSFVLSKSKLSALIRARPFLNLKLAKSPKNKKLTLSQIANRDIYREGDAASFDYLAKIYIESGAFLSQEKSEIIKVLPSYEKLFWQGEPAVSIRHDQTGLEFNKGNTVAAVSIIHSSMHTLILSRYGHDFKGRRNLTLFAECLASLTDFYFTLLINSKKGFYLNTGTSSLPIYILAASALDMPFPIAQYNRSMSNPFRAYQEAVMEMFECFKLISKYSEKLESGQILRLDSFAKSLQKLKYFVFFRDYNLCDNLLFVSHYCGKKSTQQDLKDTQECIAILKRSKSFFDFLQLMGSGQ